MSRASSFHTNLIRLSSNVVPWQFGDTTKIQELADAIVAEFRDGVSYDLEHDTAAVAYRRIANDEPLRYRELRALCAACAMKIDEHEPVVDDLVLVWRLVERLDKLSSPRDRVRCALMLTWAWTAPSAPPWTRDGLVPRFQILTTWATTQLHDHAIEAVPNSLHELALENAPALLSHIEHVAGREYASVLATGNEQPREALDRLGVPRTSWVWAHATVAAIDSAASQGHGALVALMDDRHVLDRLAEHPVVRDHGLALLLRRYSEIVPGTPEHERLRDEAIEVFGNPRSSDFQARWDQNAGVAARRMVLRWLNRKIIRYGFERLPSHDADPRRAPFWMRYADHFDDIWIHVGSESRMLRSKVVGELKEMLNGQVRRLDAEATDVFVFTIGDFDFVEFTTTGGACYIYATERGLPFDLAAHDQRPSDFKDPKMRVAHGRLIHMGDWWEHRFASEIADRTGIRPSLT